jgi:hypothetical protein
LPAILVAPLTGGTGLEVEHAGIEQTLAPVGQAALHGQELNLVDRKGIAFHDANPLVMMKVYGFIRIVLNYDNFRLKLVH